MFKLLIVNFHYIRNETSSSGIFPVSLKKLDKQIDELSTCYRFISQFELLNQIKSKSYPDEKYCLLTFDDGLKEQMTAFEFLKSKGIPGIFYIPTNSIQYRKVLNVHKLHFIRSEMDENELFGYLDRLFKITTIDFNKELLSNQYRYDTEKSRKIKYFLNFVLEENKKEEVINYLFKTVINDEHSFAEKLYMDEEDIKILANAGALGSHGSAHVPLTTISYEAAVDDIKNSVKYLENVTNFPVHSFSYPYGGEEAVNSSLSSIFQNTNIVFALTMWRGVNTVENFKNPFLLRRVDTNDAPGGKLNLKIYC